MKKNILFFLFCLTSVFFAPKKQAQKVIILEKSVVIVLAHPNLKQSKANAALIDAAKRDTAVQVLDLYERYKGADISEKLDSNLLKADRILLGKAEKIILQFPFYWFSSPALLKKWMDDLLVRGWSHMGGEALKGKKIAIALTAGEPESNYVQDKFGYTIAQILAPYQVLSNYVGAIYLEPFVMYDSYSPTPEQLKEEEIKYLEYLKP